MILRNLIEFYLTVTRLARGGGGWGCREDDTRILRQSFFDFKGTKLIFCDKETNERQLFRKDLAYIDFITKKEITLTEEILLKFVYCVVSVASTRNLKAGYLKIVTLKKKISGAGSASEERYFET